MLCSVLTNLSHDLGSLSSIAVSLSYCLACPLLAVHAGAEHYSAAGAEHAAHYAAAEGEHAAHYVAAADASQYPPGTEHAQYAAGAEHAAHYAAGTEHGQYAAADAEHAQQQYAPADAEHYVAGAEHAQHYAAGVCTVYYDQSAGARDKPSCPPAHQQCWQSCLNSTPEGTT